MNEQHPQIRLRGHKTSYSAAEVRENPDIVLSLAAIDLLTKKKTPVFVIFSFSLHFFSSSFLHLSPFSFKPSPMSACHSVTALDLC